MNFSKFFLPMCLSLVSCSAKPDLSSRVSHTKVCELQFEAFNQVYLNSESLYGVQACTMEVNSLVTQVLMQLVKVDEITDNCPFSSNIEDVIDPVLDYSKRSLLNIDETLSDMSVRTYFGLQERERFNLAKQCFVSILLIRYQYRYFSLDFGIEDVVFDHLRVKLSKIERSINESNLLFCTY